ncbi:MAG: hypothetical protein R3B09_25625 [Nannocystaceae bacterium]
MEDHRVVGGEVLRLDPLRVLEYSSPLNTTMSKPGGMVSSTWTSRAATAIVFTNWALKIFQASASWGMKTDAPLPRSVTVSIR